MTAYVSLQHLERKIDGITILKSITAEARAGQVIALLGKNGAGKTTLLETLLGFSFPSAGKASLWNVEATQISGVLKQRIGFVPQQDELLPSLTGQEHLDLCKSFRPRWNQKLVDRLTVEWTVPLNQVTGKMSVGQRQTLSILMALAHEPELLILDEPVASLDPIARRQFLQQLVEIAADEQRAIIFSTHIVSDVERVANRVWMMREGELVYQGELDTLKESFAKVTLVGTEVFTEKFALPSLLNQRLEGNIARLTFTHWDEATKAALLKHYAGHLDVQHLGLEDIFLEMNA